MLFARCLFRISIFFIGFFPSTNMKILTKFWDETHISQELVALLVRTFDGSCFPMDVPFKEVRRNLIQLVEGCRVFLQKALRCRRQNSDALRLRLDCFTHTIHVWYIYLHLVDLLGGGNSNIFYVHPENWGRFPIWLIFFKGVETTN